MQLCSGGNLTSDPLIASPMPYCYATTQNVLEKKTENVLVCWEYIVLKETVVIAANFCNAIKHFRKPVIHSSQ